LRKLTREDLSCFYTQYIASKDTRKKLSVQLVSLCEGGAGHTPDDAVIDVPKDIGDTSEDKTHVITDVTAFKSSLPLFPLLPHFQNPDIFRQ